MFYLSIKFLQNSNFLASSVKVNRGQNLVEKSTNQTRRRAAVMMSSSPGVSARLLLVLPVVGGATAVLTFGLVLVGEDHLTQVAEVANHRPHKVCADRLGRVLMPYSAPCRFSLLTL